MIGSIKTAGSGGLLTMLKEIDAEQGAPESSLRDTLTTLVPQNTSQASSASNVMSNNYTSTESGQSAYVAALLNSFAIDKEMQAKSQKDVIDNVVPDKVKEAAFWYGDSRMRQAKMLKDALESTADNLDDIKDTIEQKAQEGHTSVVDSSVANNSGFASKEGITGDSESGTPLPNLGTPDREIDKPTPLPSSPAFEGQVTTSQENAAPSPSIASDTSSNSGSGSGSAPASRDGDASTAPSAPSLDLVV